MLNRLFIVIGALAIIAIVTAFVAPMFVDWSSYRDRLESVASEALGTDVAVGGAIDITLLPQPELRLDNVEIGPADTPVARIASVKASFSLMDFLRDRYSVTQLVLSGPVFNLDIGTDGNFSMPISLPQKVDASNLSIADAAIENGTIRLTDARTGGTRTVSDFNGTLKATGLRGPFSLTGAGSYEKRAFDMHLNTSALNAEGAMQITAFAQPADKAFSLSADGLVRTSGKLAFKGKAIYRQAATESRNADEVTGDLLVTADVDANAERVLISNYTLEPDESRPATRLTGAAVLTLGAQPSFDVSVSGGVVALGAPETVEAVDTGAQSFGVLNLIDALPAPPLPPIPGRLGVDISELDLQGVTLRDLHSNLRSDGRNWSIETLTGALPGNTKLTVSGTLGTKSTAPEFDGTMSLVSTRLDALAQQWRKPETDNPLFNMPGSLSGHVHFSGGTLSLTNGQFVLDGVENALDVDISGGDRRQLSVAAQIGALNETQSNAFLALLPKIGAGTAFEQSFSGGDFAVTAEGAVLDGLAGTGLEARGTWQDGELAFERLAAQNLGGARFEASGLAAGTLAKPKLSGKGQLSLTSEASDGALEAVLAAANAPASVRKVVSAFVPAEISFDLDPPNKDGGQVLGIGGRAGAAEIDASFELSAGVLEIARAPMVTNVTLTASQPERFAAQLGLGPVALVPGDGPMSVSAKIEGSPSNSLEIAAKVAGGGDSTNFHGNVIVSDPGNLRGKGKIDYAISDISPLAAMLGAEGVGFAGVTGSAEISFTRNEMLDISNIDARVGDAIISGDLNRSLQGGEVLFAGSLRTSEIDLPTLAGLVGGPAALIGSSGPWPSGPFAMADMGRNSRGRVHVVAPFIRHAGRDIATDAGFDLTWDETGLRIRGLEAKMGGGTVALEVGVCCTSRLSDRQVTGRVSVRSVDADALLPEIPAQSLSGRLDAGVNFSGTGDSFASAVQAMTGQGSFSIANLEVAHFDPRAFTRLANTSNVIDMEPAALTQIVEEGLKGGPFTASRVAGAFTLAGGAIRVSNVAATGNDARLIGNGALELADLSLEGQWTLSPTGLLDSDGVISSNTARITAIISGTLPDPQYKLDIGPMIDAIKVRAYEQEVDRLEKLRAEQDARAKAAAEERARRAEAQARILAEERAAKARADAEKAQQDEAQKKLDALMQQLTGPDAQESDANGQQPSDGQGTGQTSKDAQPQSGEGATDQGPIDLIPPLTLPAPGFPGGAGNSF